jgi:predicted nucleic acid-binding protein
MRVYPDSCVLIYLVEDRAPWATAIRERLLPTTSALPTLVFTELTRMECRIHPIRQGNAAQLAAYERLFGNRGYQTLALGREVFEQATLLRAEQGIKTPDAMHLAAALSAGCDEFWTNDQRLQRAAQGRITVVTF